MKKTTLFIALLFVISISFSQKKKTYYKKKGYSKASVSSIHKKHMNEIVFSFDVIPMGKENESKFITEFTHGDLLNFRVYMDNPLETIIKEHQAGYVNPGYVGYTWHFILDGEDVSTSEQAGWSTKALKTWDTWRGTMNDNESPKNMGNAAYKQFINDAAIAGKMTTGNHTLEIQLFPHNPSFKRDLKLNMIASAKLTMNVKKGFKPVCLPKAQLKNVSLETQILKIIKEKAANDGWSETFKTVRIVSKDWEIETDEYLKSQIYRRIISAILTAEWPDGHCTYQGFSFSQEYKYANTYSKELKYYSTGRQVKIPCDCIK